MPRLAALLALCLGLAFSSGVDAQTRSLHGTPGRFGLGLTGGLEVIKGLQAKYFLNEGFSLQSSLGLSGEGNLLGEGLGFALDALFERPPLWSPGFGRFNWYLGVGLGVYAGSTVAVGASAILGLSFQLAALPLDLAVEYRPIVGVDELGLGVGLTSAGGALRYWF